MLQKLMGTTFEFVLGSIPKSTPSKCCYVKLNQHSDQKKKKANIV
jgi:hypothetical protein